MNDEAKFHIQVPFSYDDMIPYIDVFEKEERLPSLTKDQIKDVFSVTVAFVQTLILAKTDEKILLEIFEKPDNLIIMPHLKAINLN